MKRFHGFGFFLAIFLLFACITPHISAFTVSSFSRNPQGYQDPGTPMIADFTIDFSPGGTETFPSSNELQMRTDLVDPRWVPVLVLDGVETSLGQEKSEVLVISGWYLSYPSTQNVQVRVKLSGNIPANPSTSQNLLKIQEIDSRYHVVASANVKMSEVPVMTLSIPTTKPTTKSTTKPTTKMIFTPYPTDTPTRESPAGIETGIIAITGVVLFVIKRK